MKGIKTLYCCGVDFQHEIGEAGDLEGRMPLFSSVKRLKNERPCWDECGILELKLSCVSWAETQDLFKNVRKKRKIKAAR